MKRKILLTTLFLANIVLKAQCIPVIKANSKVVSIRDGNNFMSNAWNIVPEAKLDVYETSSSKVTFYTDLDSITFDIVTNEQYDFIILVKGKDSAHTRVVWKPSKLDILRKGKEYNSSDERSIPKFVYQTSKAPDLKKIREELKLDSIAGNGSELSQIFNLMHWVHNTVSHDGSSSNPSQRNAVDLIKVCEKEKRGVNCRMLATILNECYLAMGIPSRHITCMPKETKFDDCHVINMVYSKELKKWIWIDPTFDAYVMDEEGRVLGIREVRKKLINDELLIINADANWNRTSLQNKEHYLNYYMAKNLYRLQTPLISVYNGETEKKGDELVYVELLPLDGINQKREDVIDKENVSYIIHKTNNPDVFWKKP